MVKQEKAEYIKVDVEGGGSRDNFTFFLMLSIILMILIVVALFIYFTFYSQEEDLLVEIGKSFNMTKYQAVKFSIDNNEYSFTLDKINTNYVNITFNSTKVGLKAGEEKNITIDNKRIKIKLEKFDKKNPTFIISKVNITIDQSSSNIVVNQTNNNTSTVNNIVTNDTANQSSTLVENEEIIDKRCLTLGGRNCYTNQKCVGNTVHSIDNPKCCLGHCTVSFESLPCTATVRQKASEACGSECSSCACINSNESLSSSINWTTRMCLVMPGRDNKNKWADAYTGICPNNQFVNYTCVCGIYFCGHITNGKYWNYCKDDQCIDKDNCWIKADCNDNDPLTNDTCVLTTTPGVCKFV